MSKNKKSYTTLILLLVLVALYSYVFNPLRGDVKVMKAELETLEAQISESIELKGEERNIEITETDIQLLDLAIPTGFDQEFLLEKITSIAEENVVRINSISFNKAIGDASNGIQTVQISLTGTTSQENFQGFLFDLENDSRNFIIKNLSLSNSTVEASKRVNFTINLESYFT